MKEAIYLPREIKNYRNSLNVSQRVFGRKYDRTNKAVSTWEAGRVSCPLEVFVDVLNWLKKAELKVLIK